MKNMNKNYGFTLIELIITTLILAIILAFAIPSFKETIDKNQVLVAANDLLSDIRLARNEAITQNTPMTLCSSTNGTSCTATYFSKGWIILRNSDNAIISVREKLSGADQMQNLDSGDIHSNGITYLPSGRRNQSSVPSELIIFEKGNYAYWIQFTVIGTPYVTQEDALM
jgi:type IV fimbrial biogenesis protein FimT